MRIVRASLYLRTELKKAITTFEEYMKTYNEALKETEKKKAYLDAFNTFVLSLKYHTIYFEEETKRWKYLLGENRDGMLVSLQGVDPLDREMGLYQAFYHYFTLDSKNREGLDKYLNGLNESENIQAVARPDIAQEAKRVIENDDYLDRDIASEKIELFKNAIAHSKFKYDLPKSIDSIKTEEGVKTAIENLEYFYNSIKYKGLESV